MMVHLMIFKFNFKCAYRFVSYGLMNFDCLAVDLGMASKMQIVLNALYGTTLAGLAESLSLASKVGLDPSEVLEVLGHSSASSLLIREKGNGWWKRFSIKINYGHEILIPRG